MEIKLNYPPWLPLALVFSILKLDGVLDISWAKAILIPIGLSVIAEVIYILIVFICKAIENNEYNKQRTYGSRLYWDAETNTMYGDCGEELTNETS